MKAKWRTAALSGAGLLAGIALLFSLAVPARAESEGVSGNTGVQTAASGTVLPDEGETGSSEGASQSQAPQPSQPEPGASTPAPQPDDPAQQAQSGSQPTGETTGKAPLEEAGEAEADEASFALPTDDAVAADPDQLAAALAGEAPVVTVTQGFSLPSAVTVPAGRHVVLAGEAADKGVTLVSAAARHFIVEAGASLTLQNITLQGSAAGGGIVVKGSGTSLVLDSAAILGCVQGGFSTYAAIDAYSAATDPTVTVSNQSVLADNSAQYGGGLIIKGGRLTVSDSQFTGNIAAISVINGLYGGGAIHSDGTDVAITGSTFTGNKAKTRGGAVAAIGSTSFLVGGSQFSGNTANSGGAMFVTGFTGDVTIADSTFSSNKSTNSEGGAVTISSGYGNVAIKGSNFTGNTAQLFGGALDVNTLQMGDLTIADTAFTDNTALQAYYAGGTGGAVNLTMMFQNVILSGNTSFNNNKAEDFGGGLAAVMVMGQMKLADTVSFTGNTAGNRGGGMVFYAIDQGVAIGDSVSFTGNTATMGGGAIYANHLASSLAITGNAQFKNNTATHANSEGGALFMENLSGNMVVNGNALFEGNNTPNDGGAIFFSSGRGRVDIGGKARFVKNSAQFAGGAIAGVDNNAPIYIGEEAVFEGNSSFNGTVSFLRGKTSLTVGGSALFTENKGYSGGGIAMSRTKGDLVIGENARFAYNTVEGSGGAVYSSNQEGSIRIEGNAVFVGNSASSTEGGRNGYGGALYINENQKPAVIGGGVQFSLNYAAVHGGAVALVSNMAEVTLGGSARFMNNNAGENGGAVAINSSSAAVTLTDDVYFEGNSAQDGGVVEIFSPDQDVLITGRASFVDNESVGRGGVVHVSGMYGNGRLAIQGQPLFERNHAYQQGGVIYVSDYRPDSGISITGDGTQPMQFLHNYANENGGVLYVSHSTSGGEAEQYRVAVSGQVLFQDNGSYVSGGALYLPGSTVSASIGADGGSQVIFADNYSVEMGGAIVKEYGLLEVGSGTRFTGNRSLHPAADYGGKGGAIAARHAEVRMPGTQGQPVLFQNNTSYLGGAVYLAEADSAVIGHAQFEDNTATRYGGGLYVENNAASQELHRVDIQNTTFTGNAASRDGGAIATVLNQSIVHITDSTISGNSAGGRPGGRWFPLYAATGGGLYIAENQGGGQLQIERSTISGNIAPGGGGIGYNQQQQDDILPIIQLTDVRMQDNLAQSLLKTRDSKLNAWQKDNINPGMAGATYSQNLDFAYNNFDILLLDGDELPMPTATVHFDAKGGKPAPADIQVPLFSPIAAPAAPRVPGAELLGWAGENGQAWVFQDDKTGDAGQPVLGDVRLHALWDTDVYWVKFQDGDTLVDTQYVGKDTPVAETSASFDRRPHSDFARWNGPDGQPWDFDQPVTENTRLNAAWTERSYSVIYQVEGSTPPPAKTVGWNDSGLLPQEQPTKAGHQFTGWQVTAGGHSKASGTAVTDQTTYGQLAKDDDTLSIVMTAQFDKNTYAVAYQPGADDGSVKGMPAAGEAAFGSTVAVASDAPQRSGYTFAGWLADWNSATYQAGDTFAMPAAPVVLTAQWKAEAASSAPSSEAPPPPPVSSQAPASSSSAAPSRPASSSSSSSEAASRPAAGSSSASAGGGNGGTTPGGTTPGAPAAAGNAAGSAPAQDPAGGTTNIQAALPPLEGLPQKEAAMAQRQTGNPITDLLDGNVPLGGVGVTGSWSLVSLLLAAVSLAATLAAAARALILRRRGQGAGFTGAAAAAAIAAGVLGVLVPVLWLALDNLRCPTTWVNSSTPLVALAFVAGLALALAAAVLHKKAQAQHS